MPTMILWGLADHQVEEFVEVFARHADAEKMLREWLSDEPQWEAILEVVPLELEFSLN
jgi:hypothetical protein